MDAATTRGRSRSRTSAGIATEAVAQATRTAVDLIDDGAVRPALDHFAGLRAQGWPTPALLEVVVGVQAEAGRRWQADAWTVAQEHAATAVCEAVVAGLAGFRPPAVTSAAATADPATLPLLVACAEGESHELPARLVGTALEDLGWDVRVLGDVPALQLARELTATPALAVVVSATREAALPGAARTVRAAQLAGVPVVVGGPAFGSSTRRAEMLGADAWAPDLAALDELLRRWRATGPPPAREPTTVLHARGHLVFSRLRRALAADVAERVDLERKDRREVRGLADELDQLLDAVAAALLVDDPRIVGRAIAWAREVWTARGQDPDDVVALRAVVRDACSERGLDRAAELLDA